METENKNKVPLVQALVQEISKEWTPDCATFETPLLLMIGGLQGAGKTSVLQKMSSEEDIIVISPDQIRKKLFDRKYPFSENFIQIVEQTNHELTKKAISSQRSFAIDRNMTPQRIEAVKDLLTIIGYGDVYKTFSIFLDVPKDNLQLISKPSVDKSKYMQTQ